jgi:DNA-binding GntR family transcriptional regulator
MSPEPAGPHGLGADGKESGSVADLHGRIREAILRGELAPGSSLSQVELARELGVSRTPLREALRMLQREGLVQSERNRQILVAPFSVEDVEQIYCARLSLEAIAVRLSVVRLSPEQCAEVEGNLARLVHFARARDYERWELVHRELHSRLVIEAGSRLTALLRELSDHAERYRRLYTIETPRAWTTGSDEHRLIVDAVLAHDADLVARRLAAHLAKTALGVIALLDSERSPDRLHETVAALVGDADPWQD